MGSRVAGGGGGALEGEQIMRVSLRGALPPMAGREPGTAVIS